MKAFMVMYLNFLQDIKFYLLNSSKILTLKGTRHFVQNDKVVVLLFFRVVGDARPYVYQHYEFDKHTTLPYKAKGVVSHALIFTFSSCYSHRLCRCIPLFSGLFLLPAVESLLCAIH